jgi:GTPase SAR1 family protein
MYDCTDPASFEKLGSWIDAIKVHAAGDVSLLIVANKTDRPNRQVPAELGQ